MNSKSWAATVAYFVLETDKVFTDRSFETAAWWRNVKVPAGRYPVTGLVGPDGKVEDTSLQVRLEGTVTEDYFQTLYFGNPAGRPYDRTRNAGQPAVIRFSPYAHALAWAFIEGTAAEYELADGTAAEYQLADEFTAEVVHFTGLDGEPGKTARLCFTEVS